MKKYVCTICGYIYDEEKGIPEAGIAPGTKWEELPADWVCPICGALKSEFIEQKAKSASPAQPKAAAPAEASDTRELTPLELSALCSNLAKGCEKQYMAENAKLFTQIADYFKSVAPAEENVGEDGLLALIESDLNDGFPSANAAAQNDRGARRALTWSEKVTRVLRSLLTRYAAEGEAMLKNTGVYVCTICGFIYVGDTPPALCPVCKVPSWKFEKIEGSAI